MARPVREELTTKQIQCISELIMKDITGKTNEQIAEEEENRAADLANAVAKVEFLCLLEGVPVDEATAEQEGMPHA